MSTQELGRAIKDHALVHYEDGGWDVVVECWDDAEIAETIGEAEASTIAEALDAFAPLIDAFAPLIDAWSDRQADARNSAF